VSALLATAPDFAALREYTAAVGGTGATLFAPYNAGSDADLEVRSFAPGDGIDEDPVCGSGNGCVAAFLRHHAAAPNDGTKLRSSQGQRLGRAGQVSLHFAQDGGLWVGGPAVTCIEGHITV